MTEKEPQLENSVIKMMVSRLMVLKARLIRMPLSYGDDQMKYMDELVNNLEQQTVLSEQDKHLVNVIYAEYKEMYASWEKTIKSVVDTGYVCPFCKSTEIVFRTLIDGSKEFACIKCGELWSTDK